MISILILDDNLKCLEINEAAVKKALGNSIKNTILRFDDSRFITDDLLKTVDIAILDIELDGESGFDVAKRALQLNENISIIFVTGYDTFTKEAYSICADGYLTKPINHELLRKLLKKAITYKLGMDKQQAVIEFYCERNNIIIKQKSIMYIERVGRKVVICTIQKEYGTIKTLSEIEEILEDFFVKVNQGTIVNMYEITNIEDYHVYLANGKSFKMTRGYAKLAKEKYIKFKDI